MESLATSRVLTEGPMRPSLVPSRNVTGHSRGWSTPAAALSPVKLAAALGLDLKELGQVYSAECVYSELKIFIEGEEKFSRSLSCYRFIFQICCRASTD